MCGHYLRHGDCKFGMRCRFNHPNICSLADPHGDVCTHQEGAFGPTNEEVEDLPEWVCL